MTGEVSNVKTHINVTAFKTRLTSDFGVGSDTVFFTRTTIKVCHKLIIQLCKY